MKPYYQNSLGTLYNADCFEIMKELQDKSINLVLTDPPYGVDLAYDVYKDTEENWYKMFGRLIPEVRRLSSMAIMPSCQIKRLPWIYQNHPPDWLICWYKGSTGQASYIGFNDWEPLLVYGKNNTQMHDYMYIRPETGPSSHPCPKPVEWSIWLIKRATKENDLVLEPFAGSGSTLLACEKMNRRWIGVELSEAYCKIIVEKIEAERRQLKLDFENYVQEAT